MKSIYDIYIWHLYIYYIYMAVICPLTAVLDVTPICQGSYSCFHVPLVSASQVPAEGRGSGRRQGCLTGAIVSRVAGKTLGAAGLKCFGQGSNLQQHWFILLIIVLGTPYLQFREIAAASVERSSRLFHTGSGATCSSYCLFLVSAFF
jgi:hypothetical protein